MIYKSRNGIGIRVMSITLLFFLMLTNAYEVKLEDQLKKCERQLCFTKELKIWNFNKELKTEEVENLSNWAEDASEKIEKMIKNHDYCQIMRIIFLFIVILLIILGFCVYFKKWFEHTVKPNTDETINLNHLYDSAGSVGIILILVGLGIVFFVIFVQIYRTADIKAACEVLKADIATKKFLALKNLTNEMKKKVEKTQQEKNALKAVIKMQESMLNTEKIEMINTPALSDHNPPEAMESTKIYQETVELTNDSESKNSESKMTEAKIQNQSITKIQQKDRPSKKKGDNAGSKKNNQKKECILDDIDLNLFVYPIVILFTLFAICALCNFEREEEIGEITEV